MSSSCLPRLSTCASAWSRPGRFYPAIDHPVAAAGLAVRAGQRHGVVVRSGEEHVVRSPFAGVLMGLMGLPGELVSQGQTIAWLITAE